MKRLAMLFPFSVVVVAAGCPTTTECTAEARSSISLTIVDDAGMQITDAIASYSVDGGAVRDCEGFGGGALVCGWEEAGEFTVTVDALGYGAKTFTQMVEADECHVVTEVVELVLSPIDCTAQEVPSIEVTVTDVQGLDVTSGDVMWNMAAEDDLPEPCHHQSGNVWTCADEVSGELAVEIVNAGPYVDYRHLVTVDADECHVITESLAAVLQYLPD